MEFMGLVKGIFFIVVLKPPYRYVQCKLWSIESVRQFENLTCNYNSCHTNETRKVHDWSGKMMVMMPVT